MPVDTRPGLPPGDGGIRCATCGSPPSVGAWDVPWCQRCGIYLVQHEATGEWVSIAERERREAGARNTLLVAETRAKAIGAAGAARQSTPGGWRAEAGQGLPGAVWVVIITAPAGVADASAYLTPLYSGRGWHVRVVNHAQGAGFPLYAAGGERTAEFATIEEAIDAAVNALRIEASSRGI
jgi:hypothetical protein